MMIHTHKESSGFVKKRATTLASIWRDVHVVVLSEKRKASDGTTLGKWAAVESSVWARLRLRPHRHYFI